MIYRGFQTHTHNYNHLKTSRILPYTCHTSLAHRQIQNESLLKSGYIVNLDEEIEKQRQMKEKGKENYNEEKPTKS